MAGSRSPCSRDAGDTARAARSWTAHPAAVLGALAAVAASQFAWVRATNFGGVDEWLYLSLNSRGVVAFPHSNRPLALLWPWPAALLTPGGFGGYFAVHVAYLALTAWLVWALARRLAPLSARFALLAAVFALVWAPRDMARLATVQTAMNSGATCATVLALVLFVEAWVRQRTSLLAAALGVAFLAARSYEATLGLLAGAPLALFALPGHDPSRGRHAWRFVLTWLAGVGVLAALAARPLLAGGSGGLYQAAVLRSDPDPLRWLQRIGIHYREHLLPVVSWNLSELAHPGVLVAACVFGGVALVARRHAGDAPPPPRRLMVLAVLGLALAGLGYAVLALSPAVTGATRTQFLAAPGIALTLAAVVAFAASLLPPRLRGAGEWLAGTVIVALGTGHVVAMQREWDRISAFPAQQATLVGLVREAPALRDNTLLLLLDEDHAWPYALTFRHAVRIVYGDAVVGHALGSDPLLYAAAVGAEGVHVAPWSVIRGPWREGPTFHRFEEVVLFRLAGGQVSLVPAWPTPRLPPLPATARYAPRDRIAHGPRPSGQAVRR